MQAEEWTMSPSDWDSLELRAIGRKWAAEVYDIASELENYGADAAQLLLSYKHQDPTRPREITIPTMMADVLMAILLTLPRQAGAPDQPLGGNVTPLRGAPHERIRFRPLSS
jgi:hypothetical protein